MLFEKEAQHPQLLCNCGFSISLQIGLQLQSCLPTWRQVFSWAPRGTLLHVCRGLLRGTTVIFPSLCPFLALLAKSFNHALQWKPTHSAHQCHLPVPQLCIFLPDSSCCSPSVSISAFHLPALPSYWIPASSLLWQCCLPKASMFQDVPFPALQPKVTFICISAWRLH